MELGGRKILHFLWTFKIGNLKLSPNLANIKDHYELKFSLFLTYLCLVFYVIFFHFLINFIFYSLIFYLLLQAKADRKSSSHKFFFGIGFSLIRLLFKRTRRQLIKCRGKNKCTCHYCSLACFLPRHFSGKWETLRINIVCFWEVFYLPESELLPGRMEYLDKVIEQSVKYATLLLHLGINKNLLQLFGNTNTLASLLYGNKSSVLKYPPVFICSKPTMKTPEKCAISLHC